MPISWNEISNRARKFSKEFEGDSRETAESQTFWNSFFDIFGISRRRVASFEAPTKYASGAPGEIDLLWRGKLLVEQKSRGKSLIRARKEAFEYFPGIKEKDLPQYVLVCDFEKFNLLNLDTGEENNFLLKDLPDNVHLFSFIAGYDKVEIKEQDPVNIKAAEKMALLHEELLKNGYKGEQLEILLSRLLFCLFADDSGIFIPRDSFLQYILLKTNEDGSDLGMHLNNIFQALDRPEEKRQDNLDISIDQFPYVNGNLFKDQIPVASFNSKLRTILIECCSFDWKKISPSVFGSLFQAAMDPKKRRNLGAHYTSEENIMKVISTLFLDDLNMEFDTCSSITKLNNLKKKISELKFLDPACGCGNFLVITYRELRKLELKIIKKIDKIKGKGVQKVLDITNFSNITSISLNNFVGFELDIFPEKISELSMWLVDHQMNIELSSYLGNYFSKIPIKESADIFNINCIKEDWFQHLRPEEINYVIGNPPFVGTKERNKLQKEEMDLVFKGIKGSGNLDYVTCWYKRAADFIQHTNIKCAFVSTNSITQGIQPGILWRCLKERNIVINFAHTTFNWSNEVAGGAHVHVVIIGFSLIQNRDKKIFSYLDDGKILRSKVNKINSYLLNAPDIFINNSKTPISKYCPKMSYGSIGYDDNLFSFNNKKDLDNFLKDQPEAKKFIRKYMGSVEMINKEERWCLWLENISPNEIKKFKKIKNIVEQVKEYRLASNRQGTRNAAKTPYLFGEIRQPKNDYIGIPKVSSIRRKYVPIGLISKEVIANGSLNVIDKQDKFIFGILSSSIYAVWLKYIGGKMKSDYQNSIGIVYNNLPIPKFIDPKVKKNVEEVVYELLDLRQKYSNQTLADLYNPDSMPKDISEMLRKLDKAVFKSFNKNFSNEEQIIEYLFNMHNELTNNSR